MSTPYVLFFGLVESSAVMGQSDEARYNFLGDRWNENPEQIYQCTSSYGWVQDQLDAFCQQMEIEGLEFTSIQHASDASDGYLLCGADLQRTAQGLKQVITIMSSGKGKLNLRYERDVEDQAAFERAQPTLDMTDWKFEYPTSTFIKSLDRAVNDAIHEGKCLFYIMIYG